jgi:hypothetical protein
MSKVYRSKTKLLTPEDEITQARLARKHHAPLSEKGHQRRRDRLKINENRKRS